MVYLYAFACVVGMTIGQLLFKTSAAAMGQAHPATSGAVLLPFVTAMAIYGITSVAWVLILRQIELSRVYPFMGAAFILVPLGSHFFFGERLPIQYFVGAVLIVIGIIVVGTS
jgi:drug/metabolite transporter (DMT)-like permease